MQETPVWSLVREDPTYWGTTKAVFHNYWSPNSREPFSTAREATKMRSSCSATREKPEQQQRSSTVNNRKIIEKWKHLLDKDPAQPKTEKQNMYLKKTAVFTWYQVCKQLDLIKVCCRETLHCPKLHSTETLDGVYHRKPGLFILPRDLWDAP